ncbi:MAG: YwaF family protein, partial [Clostridia bacterium]|nr:YwaF family protein [Clostridia bacterium]
LSVEGLEASQGAITVRGVMIAVEMGFCTAYSGLVLARWIYDTVRLRKNKVANASIAGETAVITDTSVIANATVADVANDVIAANNKVTSDVVAGETVAQSIQDKQLRKEKVLNWVMPILGLLGMICCTMPYYAMQLLFNPDNLAMRVIDLNFYHRLYIYPIAIIPVVLYLILRDKSMETKRFVLLYYSLAALNGIMLTHKFVDFQGQGWVTALPLHLCNTALYVTPLCLTFKAKRVFYFTYFINVLGAFFAIMMPNYPTDGIQGTILMQSTIQFYFDHYQAFFMPLLVVGLGIFRRPRWKEFKYSLIGFGAYFLLMLILNGWFANYNAGVDYFFINSDFIADKLGTWAENLRNVTIAFDIGELHFVYYPVYQVLFFLVYVALSFGMWFLYELGFNVVNGWQDIAERNRKIKVDKLALEIKLDGRSIEEPMNMENANKLVLINFTKRYGSSDVYAVKDANLEVCGGQIFGFLGPNGAGKSTIIKSIVGIQTITDGSIEVCGYDVRTQSVQAKRQIGFVPDHYALYEKLTAREYINYIADLYDVSKEEREERLNRFIELFEFQSAIDNPIKTYSHGMKQKVTIMAALIHNPKVWILDEPLTGLDPNSIYQVKECMKLHASQGNIVFFSSHIIDVVERICDRIAIIRKGQIQCVRDVTDIEQTEESLEAFYMSVINGKEVDPIAVESAKSQTEKKDKPAKKKLFSKKSASDKENKK